MRVTPSLELPNHPGIFCAGDVLDNPERSKLRACWNHAAVIVRNVLDRLDGKPVLEARYKCGREFIGISMGKVRVGLRCTLGQIFDCVSPERGSFIYWHLVGNYLGELDHGTVQVANAWSSDVEVLFLSLGSKAIYYVPLAWANKEHVYYPANPLSYIIYLLYAAISKLSI